MKEVSLIDCFLLILIKRFKLNENIKIMNGTKTIFILGQVLRLPIIGKLYQDHVNNIDFSPQLK